MVTIAEIADQKLKARRLKLQSNFITEFYNEVLYTVTNIDSKNDILNGYVSFMMDSKYDFRMLSSVINDLRDTDFNLRQLVTSVELNDEDFEIIVNFNIDNNYQVN